MGIEIKKSNISELLKFRNWIVEFLPYLREKFTEEYLKNRVQHIRKGEVIEALIGKKTLGFLAWFEEADGSAYLWLEMVLPQYRKKGIGEFLLATALKETEKLGYKRVLAKVKNDNSSMLAILLKHGFSIQGVLNENGISTIFVEKKLGPKN